MKEEQYALEEEIQPVDEVIPAIHSGNLKHFVVYPVDVWVKPAQREILRERLDALWLTPKEAICPPRISPTAKKVFELLGMTEEEAKNHPMRHVLSRCMGCEPDPEVDVLSGEVEDGDVFVLGSDGLTGALDKELLQDTVNAAADAAVASKDLVELARERDGSDNITAVVVRCTASVAGN